MAEDVQAEVESLRHEYNWLLKEEVHNVLHELHTILSEACRRFPLHMFSDDDDGILMPEKFVLSSPNGSSQVRCIITLRADCICDADLTLRLHKQQNPAVQTHIYPDAPWRLQQIQDAGNHLMQALFHADVNYPNYQFKSGQQVIKVLDSMMESLTRGRACLSMPKKRSLEDLVRNPSLRCLKPILPTDVACSFFVQAQKIILNIYQLYVNNSNKVDIQARHQVECTVPWLNDTLVLFTLALQQCQQLRDKVALFMQYQAETKFQPLESCRLDLSVDETEDAELSTSISTSHHGLSPTPAYNGPAHLVAPVQEDTLIQL